jgi:threonine/homoserine/homoserine lactone efflux protein
MERRLADSSLPRAETPQPCAHEPRYPRQTSTPDFAAIKRLQQATCACGGYAVVGTPCIALWAVGGSAFRSWLGQERYRFAFNALTAAMLVAAALGMLRTT